MSSIFSSKFILTLQTLDRAEISAFERWLKSPWCNSNKNLVRLLEKLKKYYPDFNHPGPGKEHLFRQILPKGKYSARRMNNLLSEAYLAAERFLTFQNLARNPQLQTDLLSQEFQNRHLKDWFFKYSEKAIAKLEAKPVKEWEDHLALLQLYRRIYHHPNQDPRMKPGALTIVKMGEQTDLIYLLEKAAIINEKIFRNRILKNEDHLIDPELKKWDLACKGIEHIALEFYKMRFSYTEENMLDQYFELRDAFLQGFGNLNSKEQKIHFASLMNDSITLVRAGKFDITALLPLYKLGLKSGLLLHKGTLSFTRFAAIIAASNTKNDFDYTYQVIRHFIEKLDPKVQKDALAWAKAHSAYYQGQLNQCLDSLLNHDFRNKYFQQITKLLTSQVYFDLYLEDASYQMFLFNYFDAFEKWITREKFGSDKMKKSYLRFIQLSRYLAKSYGDVNFAAKQIKDVLKNETNIQASEWLKRKIEAIIILKSKRSPGNRTTS